MRDVLAKNAGTGSKSKCGISRTISGRLTPIVGPIQNVYYSIFAKDHYLGLHYISRHGYHAKTKHGMYSRTCLFHEFQCCIPNLNNR